MSGRTRVGLLGAGYILDAHAAALRVTPEAELVAVCDVARARAERAAAKYGIPQVFDRIEALAAAELDVVHVLLPPALHIDAAARLVDAGKSVFIEKPMGLASGECAALVERAAAKGVTVGVNHNFLFGRGYEKLRGALLSGALGRVDHVAASWHYALPLLQFGPFDNWIVAAPANVVFEVGPHVAAFIVDLIGAPKVDSAVAGRPIVLPGDQTVPRHWTAACHSDTASAVFSLDLSPGEPERILRVRARGGSAVLDYGRDIVTIAATASDNPILDHVSTAATAGRSLMGQAVRDGARQVGAALAKRPGANAFEDSMARSVAAFYRGGVKALDRRHDGQFAVDVMRLCEAIAEAAGAGAPSREPKPIAMPAPAKPPTVLVVGGTGFIGRRLVRRLVDRGLGVRVLTRNVRAAALELAGLPVELVAGSHGDRARIGSALAGIKAVYHLAKSEGKRWEDYVEGDIEPTRTLAEAALAAGVERFIYTGTIASYDSADRGAVIDNHTPVDPAIARRGHYARSKAACEALLQALQRERGLPLVILRPGVVVGPGSPPAHLGVGRFANETRVDFWGDGDTPLPLVLVDDVAEALALALDAPGVIGQTLLVSGPPLLTGREYVAEVARAMGSRIDARPRATWRFWVADMAKELAKNAVRHPNRRWPTLHDWRCQGHAARFNARGTEAALDWHPVADRATFIRRGIDDAVTWSMR